MASQKHSNDEGQKALISKTKKLALRTGFYIVIVPFLMWFYFLLAIGFFFVVNPILLVVACKYPDLSVDHGSTLFTYLKSVLKEWHNEDHHQNGILGMLREYGPLKHCINQALQISSSLENKILGQRDHQYVVEYVPEKYSNSCNNYRVPAIAEKANESYHEDVVSRWQYYERTPTCVESKEKLKEFLYTNTISKMDFEEESSQNDFQSTKQSHDPKKSSPLRRSVKTSTKSLSSTPEYDRSTVRFTSPISDRPDSLPSPSSLESITIPPDPFMAALIRLRETQEHLFSVASPTSQELKAKSRRARHDDLQSIEDILANSFSLFEERPLTPVIKCPSSGSPSTPSKKVRWADTTDYAPEVYHVDEEFESPMIRAEAEEILSSLGEDILSNPSPPEPTSNLNRPLSDVTFTSPNITGCAKNPKRHRYSKSVCLSKKTPKSRETRFPTPVPESPTSTILTVESSKENSNTANFFSSGPCEDENTTIDEISFMSSNSFGASFEGKL